MKGKIRYKVHFTVYLANYYFFTLDKFPFFSSGSERNTKLGKAENFRHQSLYMHHR